MVVILILLRNGLPIALDFGGIGLQQVCDLKRIAAFTHQRLHPAL
jgi:hypothetical protein